MKKVFLTAVVMTFAGSVNLFAQGEATFFEKAIPAVLNFIYSHFLLTLAIVVLIGVILTSVRIIWSFIDLQKLGWVSKSGAAHAAAQAQAAASGTTWQETVPVSKPVGESKVSPFWSWTILALAVILVSVVWGNYYKKSLAQTKANYLIEAELAEMEKARKEANQINEHNVFVLTDDDDIEVGHQIYLKDCAVCHGEKGEGTVGPNFTDPYWIHGGSVNDIFHTIKYGVPEKGMISWKDLINPVDMQKVSSYILTLQGTNPPNQKEPEGELYVPAESADEGSEG